MKITDILPKYDTDKNWASLGKGHSYGPFYDVLFAALELKGQVNILEIGVQRGGSLLAWKECLPKANVYGVDIVDARLPQFISDGVKIFWGDFKYTEVLNHIKQIQYDLIIDDGSHLESDIVFTLQHYAHFLKPDGILVIEDTQNPEYELKVFEDHTPPGFDFEILDYRPLSNRYDDILCVIKRKS